jgi:Mg2+ and Co2+ transporter CorA
MPTRSKIQYLIHLNDCRRLAIADLQHAKTVVDRATATVVSDDFCCNQTGNPDKARAHEVFTGIQKDFGFLADRLEDLGKPLSTAREQIIEQMSLAQGQRALILTIAAAFFIPLSFVAVSPLNTLRDSQVLITTRSRSSV